MKKTCKMCGKDFTTDRDAQLYCSKQCCDKAYEKKRRERKQIDALLEKLGLRILFCWAFAENGEHYTEETHDFANEADKKRFTLAAREFYETVLDSDFDALKKLLKA